MDYGESKFAYDFARQRSMSVRIREINPTTGEITNFWESNEGWAKNSQLKSFLFSIDPSNQLIFEECSNYATDGRCLEWLDMTDSENVSEFKTKLENSIERIKKENLQISKLVRVEIVDKTTGTIISSLTAKSWVPEEVVRLFLDYNEPEDSDYKMRFFERDSEAMPYRPANPKNAEIKLFTEALRERFMNVRADNHKTREDNQRNRLS